MKRTVLAISFVFSMLANSLSVAPGMAAPGVVPPPPPAHAAAPFKLSGPYTSGNLSVFLIHGANKINAKNYLTLQEALQQKKVVVRETGDVNNLSIENNSDSVVFIQSGDIVKGGQQDRAMQSDLLVPPHTKLPLPAFCVEHGRWSQRGKESVSNFQSSDYALAGKSLKLAAKKEMDQSKVWDMVAHEQESLTRAVGAAACSPPSPTSMQLSMETKGVAENSQKHISKLKDIPNGKGDVIGYAFAVNGKVNSADVYASHELFTKLWPKLLKSTAIEAVGEIAAAKPAAKAATEADVLRSMASAESAFPAPPLPGAANGTIGPAQVSVKEDAHNLLFETKDMQNKGVWLHKNYIAK
jgi:hypothetical protein